ncbi:MAG TPA: hypothetical protein VGD08_01145 [Stellaceae bacterium]|jgi:hypothetical protein
METIAFAALAVCVVGTGAVLAVVSELPRAILDRAQTAGRFVGAFADVKAPARRTAANFGGIANDQRRAA